MSKYTIADLLKPETPRSTSPSCYSETLSSPKRPTTPLEPYIRKSLKDHSPSRGQKRPRSQEIDCQDARLRINSRERRRMHDLNSAMDSLRSALPYSTNPSVRKLSKIATLVLARNHIHSLNQSIIDLQREKLVLEMRLAQVQGVCPVAPPGFDLPNGGTRSGESAPLDRKA